MISFLIVTVIIILIILIRVIFIFSLSMDKNIREQDTQETKHILPGSPLAKFYLLSNEHSPMVIILFHLSMLGANFKQACNNQKERYQSSIIEKNSIQLKLKNVLINDLNL